MNITPISSGTWDMASPSRMPNATYISRVEKVHKASFQSSQDFLQNREIFLQSRMMRIHGDWMRVSNLRNTVPSFSIYTTTGLKRVNTSRPWTKEYLA